MRLLWIVNLELPDIARHEKRKVTLGGWTHLLSQQLKDVEDVELFIACRFQGSAYFGVEINGIHYYSFHPKRQKMKSDIEKIYQAVSPDLVHIWGTEFIHTYAALCVSKKRNLLDYTIISIQGLVSVIARHYTIGLPEKVIHHRTLAEIIGRNIYINIADAQRNMEQRGEVEIKAIKLARHCIGRTDWDFACVMQINPHINYCVCNETLRQEFYFDQWSITKCQKHTVFFSQAHYPIKGVHILIEALSIVQNVFPDVKVKIAANDIFSISGLKSKVVKKSYEQYLRQEINRYNLREHIEWLGELSAEQMKEQYCKANVFVCASTIENSSNSIAEAMLLGVPIVASDVGGVKSLMDHNKEGILYQETAPYMLADGIIRIFKDDALAIQLGEKARERAQQTHNREKNKQTLLAIYEKIYAESGRKSEENKQKLGDEKWI